jgi:hypothetical protein
MKDVKKQSQPKTAHKSITTMTPFSPTCCPSGWLSKSKLPFGINVDRDCAVGSSRQSAPQLSVKLRTAGKGF